MEDAIAVYPNLTPDAELPDTNRKETCSAGKSSQRQLALFGIYDGHGGKQAAQFCSKTIPKLVGQHLARNENLEQALSQTYTECDNLLRQHLTDNFSDSTEYASGCTAVSLCIDINPEHGKMNLACANLGDSRCILVHTSGEVTPLSKDHTPALEEERTRIEAAGGFISDGKGKKQDRVLGIIAVSRALGDFSLKMPAVCSWGSKSMPITEDIVSGQPEIITRCCTPQEEYAIIMACDGIWDVFSSNDAADFLLRQSRTFKRRKPGATPDESATFLAEAIVQEALVRRSRDNCSCIVVLLNDLPKQVSQTCCIT